MQCVCIDWKCKMCENITIVSANTCSACVFCIAQSLVHIYLLVAASISSGTLNVGSRRSMTSVDAVIAEAGCYVSSSTTRLTHWQRPSAASSSHVCCRELCLRCALARTSFDGRPDCFRSSSHAHTTLHKVPKGAIWVAVHLSSST